MSHRFRDDGLSMWLVSVSLKPRFLCCAIEVPDPLGSPSNRAATGCQRPCESSECPGITVFCASMMLDALLVWWVSHECRDGVA